MVCSLADNVPNAVWVWDIQKLRLFVVLEQLCPVRSFQWDPQQARLAICTGGSKVYLWSPAGCMSVQVPGEGKHIPGQGLWPLMQSGTSWARLLKPAVHSTVILVILSPHLSGSLKALPNVYTWQGTHCPLSIA